MAKATPRPDFPEMARVVATAITLGPPDNALALARRFASVARDRKDLFPAFSHLAAARLLADAGAPEDEVRAGLDLALGEFPDGNPLLGIGAVSGAILWGPSGLEGQARAEAARLSARLGDLDAAIRLMDGIRNPQFAWADMLSPDIPTTSIDTLLQAATDLSDEDLAYVQALTAQEMAMTDSVQRAWATATTERLLAGELFSGPRGPSILAILAQVGAALNRPDLQRRAIDRAGMQALGSGDFMALLDAGFALHELGPAPYSILR